MFCLAGCGEKPMTAVYFHIDDNSWYFADLDTDTIFSGTIPDKLTDENGKKLTEEDMTDGDVYLIYGDGIMLESFPGQYPGITKMVRKEQGNQEKADHYRKELLSSEDRELSLLMQRKYPREYQCSVKVAEYIMQATGSRLSEEEIMYLSVHIRRVSTIDL